MSFIVSQNNWCWKGPSRCCLVQSPTQRALIGSGCSGSCQVKPWALPNMGISHLPSQYLTAFMVIFFSYILLEFPMLQLVSVACHSASTRKVRLCLLCTLRSGSCSCQVPTGLPVLQDGRTHLFQLLLISLSFSSYVCAPAPWSIWWPADGLAAACHIFPGLWNLHATRKPICAGATLIFSASFQF